jgi:hypothetical protein
VKKIFSSEPDVAVRGAAAKIASLSAQPAPDHNKQVMELFRNSGTLCIRFFRTESNISAVSKQQGTVLFSENGSIYPKTV